MKILLIAGFYTDPKVIKQNEYTNIIMFLKLLNFKVDVFNYNQNENLLDVYNRLKKIIKLTKYNILIAHSMGGALLMKYCNSHVMSSYNKIIFLMPLIIPVPSIKMITQIPFIEKIYVPKLILVPNSKCYDTGNILNDTSFKFIPVKQIVQTYNNLLLKNEDDVIRIINKLPNCYLFYASEEKFNMINTNILKKIKKTIYVDGLHEAFNSIFNNTDFFNKFKKVLLN